MEKLLFSPEEAAEILNVGRSTIYDLIRLRVLTSVKIGKARRIPAESLRFYVEQLIESQAS